MQDVTEITIGSVNVSVIHRVNELDLHVQWKSQNHFFASTITAVGRIRPLPAGHFMQVQ